MVASFCAEITRSPAADSAPLFTVAETVLLTSLSTNIAPTAVALEGVILTTGKFARIE